MWVPVFECVVGQDGDREYRVGHELIDEFLEFVGARAWPNTVKAYAHDLKVFFAVVAKDPVEVTPRDVMAFVAQQRRPRAEALASGATPSGHVGTTDVRAPSRVTVMVL